MRPIFLVAAFLLAIYTSAQSPEENLKKMNIKLPEPGKPIASYVNAVKVGNLIYLAGKGPQQEGKYITGKLGDSLNVQQGYEAARLTAIIQIAVLKEMVGDLRKVKRIVKVNGFVNSTNTFYDQPKVMNGFSDLMVEVFGEKGKHARTSVSVNSLPFNMAVEVEVIVEVEE